MKTPEWYDKKIQGIKKKKRKLTSAELGKEFEGKILTTKSRKQYKEDLKREKRKYKRGERQDLKKYIDREIGRM